MERSGTWGKASPRNQSLGKATHESAPTTRLKNKEKGFGLCVFICPLCVNIAIVSPPRGSALVGGATPGFAVLRTAPPGVTHGIASPRQVKEQKLPRRTGTACASPILFIAACGNNSYQRVIGYQLSQLKRNHPSHKAGTSTSSCRNQSPIDIVDQNVSKWTTWRCRRLTMLNPSLQAGVASSLCGSAL